MGFSHWAVALGVLGLALPAATRAEEPCRDCLEAHVRHLASPAFKGRRCGGGDEAAAADWLEGELARLGFHGAFGAGRYRQTLEVVQPAYAAKPRFAAGGQVWTDGDPILVFGATRPLEGPLVRVRSVRDLPPGLAGAIALYERPSADAAIARRLMAAGAVAVVMPAPASMTQGWGRYADMPRLPTQVDGVPFADLPPPVVVHARAAVVAALRALPAGSRARLDASLAEPSRRTTANIVGVLRGASPETVLLSAHYDHIGELDGHVHAGADDNASGVAMVLELSRLLKAGPRLRRTLSVAFFGCEEEGGYGAIAYRQAPPSPLTAIVANLNFEMVGLRDPGQRVLLGLTGWERSDLGPALAAHGAPIEADRHPRAKMFERSDNYLLARRGVVAHTVTGWPMTPTYHKPTDVPDSLDYGFMAQGASGLIGPIRWLLDTEFRPAWKPGRAP